MKRFSIFLVIFLIVSLTLSFYVVEAQDIFYDITITVDEIFYLHGDMAKVTVQSNISTLVTLKVYYPNETLAFSSDRTTNLTGFAVWNLSISETMPYGTYFFKANITDSVSETWSTVLDVSNWSLTSFPYEKSWKNINYRLKAKGLIAEGFDSVLNLTLPYFDWYSTLEVKAYENNMCFLERITHAASGLKVDLTYAFIHCGVKIIINGSIPEATDFSFKFVSPQTIKKTLDSLKTGHIIFDWSDIRKAKQAFSYNKTSHKLTVQIPQNFSIDPVIFEDGFEDGFNPWTGTSGTPQIDTTVSHCGSNSCLVDLDTAEFCYKDLPSGYSNLFVRFYLNVSALPTVNNRRTAFLQMRDTAAPSSVLYIGYWRGNVADYKWWFQIEGSNYVYVEEINPLQDYCVEVEYDANDDYHCLWIDETLKLNISKAVSNAPDRIYLGSMIGTGTWAADAHIDCVVTDDTRIYCEAVGQTYTENPSITLNLSLSSIQTFYGTYSLMPSINLLFSLSSAINHILEIWSVNPSINLVFNIGATTEAFKTWIQTQAINLLFDLTSLAQRITVILNVRPSINLIFSLNSLITSYITYNQNPIINLIFSLASYVPLAIVAVEVEVSTFGTMAFVIAIIALAIGVTALTQKKRD